MIERDYIMRMLQQFFEAMAKLLKRDGKLDDGETAKMQERFDDMYEQFFHYPATHYYQISKDDILKELTEEGYCERDLFAKMQILSELLYQDALIKKDISEKCGLLEKSLYLFEYLDKNSRIYSWEREQKMEDIRKLLTEFEI